MDSAWMLLPPVSYVVIGSAPSLYDLPFEDFDHRAKGHRVIAANGAWGVVEQEFGYNPDYLCATTHITRDKLSKSEVATWHQMMNGPRPKILFADMKNTPQGVSRLQESLGPKKLVRVYPKAREEIVLGALWAAGERSGGWRSADWTAERCLRVSTGVWAVCLAVASGSPSVLVAGIDPSSQGHYGVNSIDDDLPRDHVEEDRAVLSALERANLVEVLR